MSTTDLTTHDKEVRRVIFDTLMRTGKAPLSVEVASTMGVSHDAVRESFQRLADAHMLLLQRASGEILMGGPFSAVSTPFQVESGGVSYWGNCIWDALGIPAMLHQDAVITTTCGDCGERMQLSVEGGKLAPAEGIIHFAIPARHWWDNLVYT
ncbi:MAG: hypothetical protein QOH93_3123 [Chloroflexia bacterium]|jgi:hypothetical protein|nr:hypothetical protein [Chloroflexia bacterium]